MNEIRQLIPRRCFERPLWKSSMFLARDLLCVSILFYSSTFFPVSFSSTSIVLWMGYAIVQGTFATGLWLIGHECGHGAFSSNPLINDAVGWVIHSFFLVPYFSWKRSHAKHHMRTNHLYDDEAYIPNTKPVGLNPIVRIGSYLLFGWTTYLITHMGGSIRNMKTKEKYKQAPNHYNFWGVNELLEEIRFQVFVSTLGVSTALYLILTRLGVQGALLQYFLPYVVINCWIVLYTWLQHTDTHIPFYGEDEWTWMKGALTAVNRPYPWLIDEIHHHIGTTHTVHHLFHEIPHYHAQEATDALGDKYNRYDPTPVHEALWRVATKCNYVENRSSTQYYRT